VVIGAETCPSTVRFLQESLPLVRLMRGLSAIASYKASEFALILSR
jgi:hypothetical protein